MTEALIIGALLFAVGWLATAEERHRPTHIRRGLELKARNGRLVHVRETESEHEL